MIDAAILIPVYRLQDGELHIVMILRNLSAASMADRSLSQATNTTRKMRPCSIPRCVKSEKSSV